MDQKLPSVATGARTRAELAKQILEVLQKECKAVIKMLSEPDFNELPVCWHYISF